MKLSLPGLEPGNCNGAEWGRARMKKLCSWLIVGCSLLLLSFAPFSLAQQESKGDRKLITRVEPDYPPVLRMRQIGGTVKLEISIKSNGNVDSAKVLGGNPILAESAVTAVKKWKYAAGDSSTTTTVSLDFNPYR
jgi:TonB family protein